MRDHTRTYFPGPIHSRSDLQPSSGHPERHSGKFDHHSHKSKGDHYSPDALPERYLSLDRQPGSSYPPPRSPPNVSRSRHLYADLSHRPLPVHSKFRDPPIAPRAFRERSGFSADLTWRSKTSVGGPSHVSSIGGASLEPAPHGSLEGVDPSNSAGPSGSMQQKDIRAMTYPKPAALIPTGPRVNRCKQLHLIVSLLDSLNYRFLLALTSTADSAAPTASALEAIVVPAGTWYVLEASRVDLGHCTSAYWLEQLADIHAFGVRVWKKTKRGGDSGSLSLLFKSRQARDMALRRFSMNAPPGCSRQYFVALMLTDPEAASAAHISKVDLEYINQAYAHKVRFLPAVLSLTPPAYRRAAIAHHFFESEQYPPLLATSTELCPRLNDPSRKRTMHAVSFSLDWAETLGSVHPVLSTNVHYHRLLTLMRAHTHRQGKKDMRVNIWPTNGPYDIILRTLARLAADARGSTLTPPLLDESFGFVSHQWVIKMELGLDCPRFKKHPIDLYDQDRF